MSVGKATKRKRIFTTQLQYCVLQGQKEGSKTTIKDDAGADHN
jgi:hypothetical protein